MAPLFQPGCPVRCHRSFVILVALSCTPSVFSCPSYEAQMSRSHSLGLNRGQGSLFSICWEHCAWKHCVCDSQGGIWHFPWKEHVWLLFNISSTNTHRFLSAELFSTQFQLLLEQEVIPPQGQDMAFPFSTIMA